MTKQLCIRCVSMVVLVVVVMSCEPEPLQLQSGAGCVGCSDTPPGGGTITTAPNISSFTPGHGLVTDQVAIYGSRFSTTPSSNIVKFNGVPAVVVLATATLLIAEVPATATTGKISVSVNGQQSLSVNDFEVLKDIPRNGLVLYYPFTNTYNDFSGNSRHLIAQSTVNNPMPTTDRFNKSGQAYNFDGMDDQLYTENVSITHPVTIGFWTKYTTLDIGAVVGTKGDQTPNGLAVQTVNIANNNYLITYVDNNVNYQSNFNLFPSSTSTWIFIAISFDGNTFRVYKNGVLFQTLTGQGTLTSTTYFVVGDSRNGGNYAGGIDDITVYNRVLSGAEIVQLHQQTISKY